MVDPSFSTALRAPLYARLLALRRRRIYLAAGRDVPVTLFWPPPVVTASIRMSPGRHLKR